MSDIATQSGGENNAQPETNVAENVASQEVKKGKPIDIGSEIHEHTQPPSETNGNSESSGVNDTGTESQSNASEEIFNPDIHATDENGNPKLKDDGSFAKKRGRKKAEVKQAEVMNDFNTPAPQTTIEAVGMMFGMFSMVMMKAIGPEWQPSNDEGKMMTDVWARYIHYKGWDGDLTPEFAVVICTIGFLGPRLMHPNFIARIMRKRKDAHTNNRTPGTGKNVSGQNNSPTSGEQRTTVPNP